VVDDVEGLAARLDAHRRALAAGRDRPEERRAWARRFDIHVMAERMGEIYGGLGNGRA